MLSTCLCQKQGIEAAPGQLRVPGDIRRRDEYPPSGRGSSTLTHTFPGYI